MYNTMIDKIESRLKKLVGFEDPIALSWGEWDTYYTKYKSAHPILHFIFRDVIHNASITTYCWIERPWNDFWYGLRNRFITRPTEVHIKTLNKYQYQSPDEVLLHANFQILVDFVEWELSVHKRRPLFKILRMIPILGHFIPTYRSREDGLRHLEWECNLRFDENYQESNDFNVPLSSQALCAIEKRDLYLWWTDERPKRQDPMDASGLTAYYDTNSVITPDKRNDNDVWRPMHDECVRLEQMYDAEDEAMLHRLISIRRSLWT